MRYYISILEGDAPGRASPVLATEDPVVVKAAVDAVAARLGIRLESPMPHSPLVVPGAES